MKKIILIGLLLICICQNKSVAQNSAPPVTTVHEYYVIIQGVNSKEDVKYLEKLIGKQKGVTSFSSKDFPVKFLILRSTVAISKEEIEGWLKASIYQLQFITDDPNSKKKIENM